MDPDTRIVKKRRVDRYNLFKKKMRYYKVMSILINCLDWLLKFNNKLTFFNFLP